MIKESLLSFLFPSLCPYCKSLKDTTLLFCDTCLSTISFEQEVLEYTIEKTLIFEGRCFEKSPPIENFYQAFIQDKHPKKLKLITDIALLQINTLDFTSIDAFYSPLKKGVISDLVKNLSKVLGIPIFLEKTNMSNKKVLSIFPSEVELSVFLKRSCQILYVLKFY